MIDANLLEPYRKDMRRLGTRLLRRPDLADEVVQEAFFAIMNSPKPFRGESDLKTYIHRAVYSKAINILRREAREQVSSVMVEGILGNKLDPSLRGRSPEDLLLFSEKIWYLQDAIRSLGEAQKKVLQLVLIDGLSGKEAAKILGVSPVTIRGTCFKLKKKLQKKLEGVV